MKFSRWSILNRLVLMVVTSLLLIAGIIAVNIITVNYIKQSLVSIVDEDLQQFVIKTGLRETLHDVFSSTDVLVGTFTEQRDTLEKDKTVLTEKLHEIISGLAADETDLRNGLEVYAQELEILLFHCIRINSFLKILERIQASIETDLAHLDGIVVEKEITLMVDTSAEAEAIKQFAILLPGYNEIYFEIKTGFLEAKHAYLLTRKINVEHERTLQALWEEFEVGLEATTIGWKDIQPILTGIKSSVLGFRKVSTEAFIDMREFNVQVNSLARSQKELIALIETFNQRAAKNAYDMRNKISQELSEMTHITLLLSIIIIVILLFLGVFAVQLVRPLKKLARQVTNFGAGEFDASFDSEASGEIGVLGQAFNQMGVQIKDTIFSLEGEIDRRRMAEASLQEAHNNLEHKVELRTSELTQANTKLEQEITERKQAEEELQKSRNILQQTQALARVGGWEWDIVTNQNVWSEEQFRIFGYEPGAVSPNYDMFVQALHPEDRDRVLAAVQRCIDEGEPYQAEYRILRPDGAERIVAANGEVALDALGRPTRMVSSVLDITARKRAEQELSTERERLAVTLQSIGDGVITTDKDGRVTLINHIAEQLTGWLESEALGHPLPEVFQTVNEVTRQPCENPVEQVIERGQVIGLANNTVLIAKDGREHVIADSGAPILDTTRRIIGVVLVFRDISETRKLESEILKIEKLESLGMLAGGIAHDFNNFLTGIIGNVSLAKMDAAPNDAVYSRLAEMEKAAMRAKDLTQQLLTFSKGGEPVRRPSELDRLVEESASFALRGSNVRSEFDMQSDLWPCEIDEGQISQVIHNLIINASQAMPEGGVIQLRCANMVLEPDNPFALQEGNYVKVSLQDEGIGIQRDQLKKVFDPYFTTKQKGSGLGLAVVYSIIDKHNGRITVDSELGVGTLFDIYLPASPEVDLHEKGIEEMLHLGTGKILVMDDEDFIRELASHMLEKMGYTVTLAKDGQEAIKSYTQAFESNERFNAVILDLTIPGGMGGKETIMRLLEIDPDVRAIVSSGYSTDPVMADYGRYGFRKAVKKPYLIKELSEALHSVLGPGSKD